ncbi:MAG TPA: carbohydrate ABC transporter permease [Candidatus Hydrogenedentes bacterium]|nr:carbohydrate ABC transporter permease [Candidatus Hydrogenedentota bacterium]
MMAESSKKSPVERLIIWTLLILLGFVFLIPFFITVGDSLKTFRQVFAQPRIWIPIPPQWHNYVDIFLVLPFFTFFKNTLMITALALFGQICSACLVGYSFARLRWPFRDTCFVILLSTMMLPGQVTMIPIFLLFNKLGWVNTWLPIIVPAYFGVNVFNVFLMRQFFKTIPYSLEEAALIDGAGHLRILTTIMIPLAKPAVLTIGILGFVHWWNDFMGPLIYLSDHTKYPISLGIKMFSDSQLSNPHYIMAASFVAILPVLFLFFSAQKYFVKGIALTGQKD